MPSARCWPPGRRSPGPSPGTGSTPDRKIALGLLAAREAWGDAGCTVADRGAALVAAVGLEQAALEDFVPIFDGARIDWARAPGAALPTVPFRAPIDGVLQALARGLELA